MAKSIYHPSKRKSDGFLILFQVVFLSSVVALTEAQASTSRPLIRQVTIPPLITSQPDKTIAYKLGESIELPCVASGEPVPSYSWLWNDQDFSASGKQRRVVKQPGVGTLIFADPQIDDEAIYQCRAHNQVGEARTVKIDLRLAKLGQFTSKQPVVHRPTLGHALTLSCLPPESYPPAEIFWAVLPDGANFVPLDLTDRVSIDPDGHLHFANIISEDFQNGQQYACVVENRVMREIRKGDLATIRPVGETPQNLAPRVVYGSPTRQMALRGTTWRIKCIFSGRPTPRIEWSRGTGVMSPRARQESFGQELVIENTQFDDAGRYECAGINDETSVPERKSFTLKVEAAPYWRAGERPTSVDAAEGDTATFKCGADGLPDPNFLWFLNGISTDKVPADPRRILSKNSLTFMNMTKDDAMVIQCNVTNKHGYIWANAYLNVLTEPAFIRVPPLAVKKAAEGQTVNLTCEVFGSPKPLVIWHKGSEQLTGGRFRVTPDGHLEISDVSLVDAGLYTCTAQNTYGSDSKSGSLLVRRKTQIQTRPLDVMVYEKTEAKFTCTATTDPEEVSRLRIDWLKDGQLVNFRVAQRVFKNDMDNSLTISGTNNRDTGKYTCVASNGLDSSSASAELVVQAPPDPPNSVQVRCFNAERRAEIRWSPSKENYAPILNFVIQFNTSFTPDTWVDIASNVSQNRRRLDVPMSPWGNYTFRVLARNKIGLSPPSVHSTEVCRTEAARPTKNPDNVVAEGDQPDNLIIYWTPMPRIEQNGPSFVYVVSWRLADESGAQQRTDRVENPSLYHYIIKDQNIQTYRPYDVYVKASNQKGDSLEPVTIVRGYSGEDVPLTTPSDVSVDTSTITATTARVTWTPVDSSANVIRGFFRGYRIQFWKESAGPAAMREQDHIINRATVFPRTRFRRQVAAGCGSDSTVCVDVRHLPAFSDVVLQVRVLNKYYVGEPSPQVRFRTSQGAPGPPASFAVTVRGSTHFELDWESPLEPNGQLIGFNISYQTIHNLNLGRLQYRQPITDPTRLRTRLTGLMPDTDYRVYLHAVSRPGTGEPIFLDMRTLPAGVPNPPTFMVTAVGETWVNVTWTPSRSGNPGSVFYAQYRKRGQFHWLDSRDEAVVFTMTIIDIDPGTGYQLRMISKNGEGYEAAAEYQEFITSGVAPGTRERSRLGWVFGIFASLLIILIFLILFVFAKRKTDVWWERKEGAIDDQMRQLQAEEAARQLGIVNEYARTGSREMLNTDSYSDVKPPLAAGVAPAGVPAPGYEDEEDEDDEDEYQDEYDDRYEKRTAPPAVHSSVPEVDYRGAQPAAAAPAPPADPSKPIAWRGGKPVYADQPAPVAPFEKPAPAQPAVTWRGGKPIYHTQPAPAAPGQLDRSYEDHPERTRPYREQPAQLAPPPARVSTTGMHPAMQLAGMHPAMQPLSGSRDHLGGSRDHLGGSRDHLGGSRDRLGGSREYLGGSRDQLAPTHHGSRDDLRGSRDDYRAPSPGADPRYQNLYPAESEAKGDTFV